jgi:hypothetical protein
MALPSVQVRESRPYYGRLLLPVHSVRRYLDAVYLGWRKKVGKNETSCCCGLLGELAGLCSCKLPARVPGKGNGGASDAC